jgi:thioredoxin reductase
MFSGKDVVVIGGGNAGFESAAQLLAYTNSVTLLNRSNEFKADPITIEAVLQDPKMTAIKNADTQRILADTFVTGLVYNDTISGDEKELACQGIFVEIGSVPTTTMIADITELDESNHVKVDPWTQRTTQEGIWAAGDCTNGKYHQNNIAAGDAVKALEDIYVWIKKNK